LALRKVVRPRTSWARAPRGGTSGVRNPGADQVLRGRTDLWKSGLTAVARRSA